MLKKLLSNRRRIKADDAFGIMVGGLIAIAMLLLFGVFIIMMIEKIAYAIVLLGIGILALGAGVMLLKKGMSWMKKGA